MKRSKRCMVIVGLLILSVLPYESIWAQTRKNGEKSFQFRSDNNNSSSKIKERELTISIGDSTTESTKAELEIKLWRGECHFKINLLARNNGQSRLLTDSKFSYDKGVIALVDSMYRHQLYPIDSTGFEWEFVLSQKPKQHQFEFSFSYENLEFVYQDSLSDREKEFCVRPDSVLYSYAVFHSSRRDNFKTVSTTDTSGINYGSGKAFHLYRPKAWDTNRDTVWCELDLDTINNIMTLIVDSLFLESAIYPVVIDPTIGYTTMGGSGYAFSNYSKTANWSLPETLSVNATLDSAYLGVQGFMPAINKDKYNVAVYDYDESDSNNCNYVTDVVWEKRPTDVIEWKNTAMGGDTLYADSIYIVAFASENNNFAGNLRIMYDSYGSIGDAKYLGGETDLNWPSTLGSFADDFGFRYSAYMVYTIESSLNLRRRKISKQ